MMGKTGGASTSWLGLMKKAFRSPVKENDKRSSRRREDADQEEEEEKKRGKRRWIFKKPTIHETTILHNQESETATNNTTSSTTKGNILATNLLPENFDSKQMRANAVAMPPSTVVVSRRRAREQAAQAAVDIIQLTRPTFLVKEDRAILIIQTAFRGYLARKALGALKGLVKLQALIRGHNIRKRAKMTLQCMQSLVRVQTQVCDQRRRLSCDGINCGSMFREPKSILELHLSDKESTSLLMKSKILINIFKNRRTFKSTHQASTADDGYYDHLHALEKVEALLQKAKEAAKTRENTLAHAFSRKMWTSNKDEHASSNKELDEEDLSIFRVKNCKNNLSRTSCDQPRDHIKNIEIDTACSYSDSDTEFWRLHHQYYQEQQQKFYSYANIMNGLPMTPPLKMKNLLVHSASPRCRREEKSHQRMMTLLFRGNSADNSCRSADRQPNYMTATASARARERSQSAPRRMPMTPEREKTSSVAKKRLSFPVQ